MTSLKEQWKQHIVAALRQIAMEKGATSGDVDASQLLLEVPPRAELGDLASPLFPFARLLRMAPAAIAAEVVQRLSGVPGGTCEQAGPYINIRYDQAAVIGEVLAQVRRQGDSYGHTDELADQRIMVEFSCPNTNKPLHLGHLRNDILGESLSRILAANGADVRKVNLINDRGVHICKSMLAYRKFGNSATPQSEGIKSDHFVGQYYVRFNQWAKEDPTAETQARDMLNAWEAGDPEVIELWQQMNQWAIDGIVKTYERTGISFDAIYYESRTYLSGRSEVLRGLQEGVFYRDADGSVWVDLEEINLDKKVLLRADGTSLYLTQDIGTAIARHNDWPFDRLVYVVASEQRYHFVVLFHVLQKLGLQWGSNLSHLAYGMVNLPDGKMKSREGTVVDADELIAGLERMAAEEIRAKGREQDVGDVAAVSADVALGALHYYLLQVNPVKDMVFDPKESISFNGNTGPYLQYTGARISSMLRKLEATGGASLLSSGAVDTSLLGESLEWELAKRIGEFPECVRTAARQYSPSVITGYLYDLAKTFSRYYHDYPIVIEKDDALRCARTELATAVVTTLRNGCRLIAVPFLDVM
jgi:arginyl-tRNA synthetase